MNKSASVGPVRAQGEVAVRPQPKPYYDWSSTDIDQEFRRLVSESSSPDLRVAWLANHTIEPVCRATMVLAHDYGVRIENNIGPYDQYFQPLLEECSDILAGNPNVIVLWLSLRALAPSLVEGGAALSEGEVRKEIERVRQTIQEWVSLAQNSANSHLMVCNFARPPASRFGVADNSCATGEHYIYDQLNRWLSDEYASDSRVTVTDVNHAVALSGSRGAWNPRMYRLAKIEWDGCAARSIAALLSRSLRALVKPTRKCIVLDLDNTLWGGVLGEEGPAGIQVGESDPISESFAAFQRALKDIKARGILLAICSKNNQEDVDELFETRSEMPLSAADFSATRVNWENKHENIMSIAEELNIGTDSLAFVDDNPSECELVRQLLPEVLTIQLPDDPAEYADLLFAMPDFDSITITEEDRQKTAQYAANAARNEEKRSTKDLTSYLESLGTKLTIRSAVSSDLTRIHQLFTKTNQFNLTTIRYGTDRIQGMLESDEWVLKVSSVSDNFGDLGIVGLYLVHLHEGRAEIDSFVLSCRALGRGIETAVCNELKQSVFDNSSFEMLTARFLPTAKNRPAADFLDKQGFERIAALEDGTLHYRMLKSECEDRPAPGILLSITEG